MRASGAPADFAYRLPQGYPDEQTAPRQDGRELLELAPKIPIRTEVHTFALEEANRVLGMLKGSEFTGTAVLEINRL